MSARGACPVGDVMAHEEEGQALEEGQDRDAHDDHDDHQEEAREARLERDPGTPSREKYNYHVLTHLTCRACCLQDEDKAHHTGDETNNAPASSRHWY